LLGLNPGVRRVLLVICLGLAATACGDDDDASSPADDGGARPDSGPDPDPDPDPDPPDAGQPPPRDSGPEDGGPVIDASEPEPEPDAAIDAGTDAAVEEPPLSLGGLTVNMSIDEQASALDLFGTFGHRFWVEVSTEQRLLINEQAGGGGGINGDDIYTPGGDAKSTYADHVLVQDATSMSVADYGQVEVKLVGESTARRWSSEQIPNLKLDADEFEKGKKIGGFEHIRLNNSLVGSIFREHLAHTIYRALDYPALRTGYAFLGSNVWGDDIWVPMTLMEVYKKKFCNDNTELLGGTCTNMWEFAGDLGQPDGGGCPFCGPRLGPQVLPIDPFPPPTGGEEPGVSDAWCQLSECDNTRLEAVIEVINATEVGTGFQAALDPYVDWDLYHQFQCLSWIMWTGDDPVHGGNNNLIVEREDGKLVWAPYSVDISAGQDWYTNVPLPGTTALPRGCQSEPSCWAETIASCEDLIARFDALNPEDLLDERYAALEALGMLRDGDQERAEDLRAWLVWRQTALPAELERFRYLPDANGQCPDTMQRCEDDTCGSEAQCEDRRCPVGVTYCESMGRCVDPRYEPECPSCEDVEKPFYCEGVLECVADQEACILACNDTPDKEWCADAQACVPLGQCGGIIE
jgi:hypothetical protein